MNLKNKEINIDLFKIASLLIGIAIAYYIHHLIYFKEITAFKKITITEIKSKPLPKKEEPAPSKEELISKSEPLPLPKIEESKKTPPKKEEPKSVNPILPDSTPVEKTEIESEPIYEQLPEIAAVDDEPLPPLLEETIEEHPTNPLATISQPMDSTTVQKPTPAQIDSIMKNKSVELGSSLVMEFEIDRTGTILNIRPIKLSRDYLFNITMLMGSMGKIYKIKEAESLQPGQTMWVRLPPLTPVEKDKPLLP